MPLTSHQRDLITATVPILAQHGKTVSQIFYTKLLNDNPSLRNLFSHSAQITSHQAAALASSVYAYAANINDLTPILPMVEKISQKHASLSIQPEQYTLVGKGLLAAMREVLGADVFTDEIRDAWLAAYFDLADIMIGKEGGIIEQHEKMTGGWKGWRAMRLVRKVKESDEVTSFYWSPVDGGLLPSYSAGQYVSVRINVHSLGFKQIRQYSLSAAPPSQDPASQAQASYRITVKREAGLSTKNPSSKHDPGYVSNLLHETYHEGDVADMSHPCGEFFLDSDVGSTTPVVLISAGVGLTPLMSMLQTLLIETSRTEEKKVEPRSISWIHVARNKAADPFADDIAAITREHDNVRSMVCHSSPAKDEKAGLDYDVQGRLSLINMSTNDRKQLLLVDEVRAQYFICGPNDFMADMSTSLERMGVAEDRIKMEVFGAGEAGAS